MQKSNFSLGEARIRADTAWDAKNVAKEYGFYKSFNVTKAWVKAGKPLGPRNLKTFEIDYIIAKKRWRKQGIGIGHIITIKPSIHERFVTCTINEFPKIKKKEVIRIYELRLASDSTLIAQVKQYDKAIKLARKLSKKYKEDIYCNMVYRIPDLDRKVFEAKYKEPKGEYLLFGLIDTTPKIKTIEVKDVNIQ